MERQYSDLGIANFARMSRQPGEREPVIQSRTPVCAASAPLTLTIPAKAGTHRASHVSLPRASSSKKSAADRSLRQRGSRPFAGKEERGGTRHFLCSPAQLDYRLGGAHAESQRAADAPSAHPSPSFIRNLGSSKKARSSCLSFSNAAKVYLSNASANVALSERSANAISGSIIQNSARWRLVFEFSARKVGPKV
jgi:hypothetical protein